MIDDRPEDFKTFLHDWETRNISSLGQATDPSDWNFIAQRKAADLIEAAAMNGFLSELGAAMRSYGDPSDRGHSPDKAVANYLRGLLERATLTKWART